MRISRVLSVCPGVESARPSNQNIDGVNALRSPGAHRVSPISAISVTACPGVHLKILREVAIYR